MTWAYAGAAALTIATSYFSAESAKGTAIRGLNAQSRAEGDAVVRERLNQTIQNSYATALGQAQLALKKRQLSTGDASIGAAGLAAKSEATLANAATGSIGQSTNAVMSDIDQKVQTAHDQVDEQYSQALQNYNTQLEMMAVNTGVTAPQVRAAEYTGPSDGEILGSSIMQGMAQFAAGYASRKMKLGLGSPGGGSGVTTQTDYSLGSVQSTGFKTAGYTW
jgi:hypothetical protein